MRIDELDRIYIRQSWLGDALMCPERARLSALHPELRKYNDSAAMGTSVHTAIEEILNENCDPQEASDRAVEAFDKIRFDLAQEGKQLNITNTEPRNWHKHVASMAQAWVRDIYPEVPRGGKTEFQFSTQVGMVERVQPAEDGSTHHELHFEGTMDYICDGQIFDWKTAARKYYQSEKQNQNIQSSIYAKAAVELGLAEYPVTFGFGVMIRNASSTAQIVTVERTKGHGSWIVAQASAIATMVLTMEKNSPTSSWLINDQHFLCSQRWCPVWSLCKGRHISDDNSNGLGA